LIRETSEARMAYLEAQQFIAETQETSLRPPRRFSNQT